MAISDEIKREKQKTKDMDLKGKLSYFWDYYKIHTIVAAVALFLIITMIRDIAAAKDYAFYGVYFNALQTFSAEEQMSAFSEYLELDTENYEAMLDSTMYYSFTDLSETSLAASQKFFAMIQTGDIDVTIADEEIFTNYAVNEIFFDLREVLPKDLLEKYKDDIFYIDGAQIAARNADDYWESEDGQDYHRDSEKASTDHHDPSLLEDPIPVGIYVGGTPVISKAGCYTELVPVFGIVKNTSRADTAVKYLRFLGGEAR